MNPSLTRITFRLLACILPLAAAAPAWAQSYPTKAIQIVVPYAPGGSSDFAARQLSHRLETRLGQPVVVVNRPGASGTIGVTQVARAEPDGYTLLLGLNTEMVIVPQLTRNTPYDLDKFEPISIVGSTPLVLVGKKEFRANDMRGLIEEIRAQPGKINFGGAVGSPAHISGSWLRRAAKLDIAHVPYKGGAQAANDVAGGSLDLYFSGILPAKPLIEAGRIKAYVVTGEKRSSTLPNVPTMAEAGIPDFVLGNWTAMFAPKGTPAPVVALLKKNVREILAEPDFRAAMQKEGIDIPATDDPAGFLKAEHDKFGRLLKELDISGS
ncbi:tripartite tricarboxylate transporter substrate binding protein [Pigmentiphaga soli]|uniref:Tripartite tricarboxylate transporter substrate binding protein n=1 Tax=Pigmentiphaga soli TaxID=1007095 RepID=A0ABP8GTC4_9BURK